MTHTDTNDRGFTVVTIPTEKTQAVLDFVSTLTTEETDVTGHMLSTGAAIGGGPLQAKMGRTLSSCWRTGAASGPATDWSCSDTDPVV